MTHEDALRFDWRAIIHPEDVDRLTAESVAGEATLEPFTLEGRFRGKIGRAHV